MISAQQALTSTLSGVVSYAVSLLLALAAMLWLSWQVTLVALALIPLFTVFSTCPLLETRVPGSPAAV